VLKNARPLDKTGTVGSVMLGWLSVTCSAIVTVVAVAGNGSLSVGVKPPTAGNATETKVDAVPAGSDTVEDCVAENDACEGIGNGVGATTGGNVAPGPFAPGPHAANTAATETRQKSAEKRREPDNGNFIHLSMQATDDKNNRPEERHSRDLNTRIRSAPTVSLAKQPAGNSAVGNAGCFHYRERRSYAERF
jgi:hypothetical protein